MFASDMTIRGNEKPFRLYLVANIAETKELTGIIEVIKDDLNASRKFDVNHIVHNSIPNHSNHHYIVFVEITRSRGPSKADVKIKIIDGVHRKEICKIDDFSFEITNYEPNTQLWRRLSHKISDIIFEKIQHIKGHFSHAISFSKKLGNNGSALYLADYDGFNASIIAKSKGVILSPEFSPCGNYILYRSLNKQHGQTAYVLDLHSGKSFNLSKHLINKFGKDILGKNISSLSFGRNKNEFLLARSFNGSTQMYLVNIANNNIKKIYEKKQHIIETCPVLSPDGETFTFSSDMDGAESLYVVNANRALKIAINNPDFNCYSQTVWVKDIKTRNRLFFSGRGPEYASIWFLDCPNKEALIDGSGSKCLISVRKPAFVERPVPSANGMYVILIYETGMNAQLVMVDSNGNEIMIKGNGLYSHLSGNIRSVAWSHVVDFRIP